VEQICALQFGGVIGGTICVNKQRKSDACLFAEYSSIVEIAHADRREIRATRVDFSLMLAQLRDMLAAENSAVVAQENDDGRLGLPQRAEPNPTLVSIGENDFGQLCAKACSGHLFRSPSSPGEFTVRFGRAYREKLNGPA
jgi:hypothetical protein